MTPGNAYDGHTVNRALGQVQIITEMTPTIAMADLGYKGIIPTAQGCY